MRSSRHNSTRAHERRASATVQGERGGMVGVTWSARSRAVPASCPGSALCRSRHGMGRRVSATIGRCHHRTGGFCRFRARLSQPLLQRAGCGAFRSRFGDIGVSRVYARQAFGFFVGVGHHMCMTTGAVTSSLFSLERCTDTRPQASSDSPPCPARDTLQAGGLPCRTRRDAPDG